MIRRLLIVGAGAQARYVIETTKRLGLPRPVGLIDTFENKEYWGRQFDGVTVLGGTAALDQIAPAEDLGVVLAVADTTRKQQLVDTLSARGYRFESIVHPAAILASDVRIGAGTIVNAGVVIERGTRIGSHVIVHAGCVIEHDNVVEDYANLAPGVVTAGRVRIELGATVFTGARITPDVVIGRGAVVGAGAVVINSVAAGSTVVGVPAREVARVGESRPSPAAT